MSGESVQLMHVYPSHGLVAYLLLMVVSGRDVDIIL